MSGQVREMVNATEGLVTVAWENCLQKLPQGSSWPGCSDHHYHLRVLTETLHRSDSDLKYGIFLRRLWRTGLSAARRTDIGTIFESQRRLHEVDRGPHACLFRRLHLPTSSCSNLWRNKISDRGGGLISAERNKSRGRTVRERVQHCFPLPYRPPERWGNDQKLFLKG